jgi:prepilin-type processing-associated H-X9-DG protein
MSPSNEKMSETETQGQKPKTCKFATASAVLGVVVLCLWLICMMVTSPSKIAELVVNILFIVSMTCAAVGLILGILALVKIGRSNSQLVGKGLAILGVGVTGFIILFFSFGYLVMQHKYGIGSTVWIVDCKNNLHQLGKTMRVYANNNEGKYPTPDKWCDLLLQRDLATEKQFICPSGGEGRCHYAMNPNCEPSSPNDVVLLFETRSGWNQFGGPELLAPENHGGRGCNILFSDGHVGYEHTEGFGELKWK